MAANGAAIAQDTSSAQQDPPDGIDAFVAAALTANPRILAARDRIEAARARERAAGLLPDPILSIGVQNVPIGRERSQADDLPDMMTMRLAGIGQSIPFPGKRSLERRIEHHETESAEADLLAVQRDVIREVRETYYSLAFLDRSLEILARNQEVLASLIRTTEARYVVGFATQPDVLKTRIEMGRLAEEAVMLAEERNSRVAQLNALLDRETGVPVGTARIPQRIERAAVAATAEGVRFTSSALSAHAADSPLPSLQELQATALRSNADLLAHEAMTRAQATRVERARRDYLPDFDLSLMYGQRSRRPDMITATISVPVPWQKGRKHDQVASAAGRELSALEAEHQEQSNRVRARIAELYAGLDGLRAQLGLYVKAILPQGYASLSSATAGFQVGRADFQALLDAHATVLRYEIAYHRALADFATRLATLEAVVGKEILQ
jgi:outer membrane protein TolC